MRSTTRSFSVIRSAGEGLGHIIIGSNQVSENPNWEESLTSASLQRSAERLRRPPSLLITNVRVAHSGADIFVAEQLLDLEQILSHVVDAGIEPRWRSSLAAGRATTHIAKKLLPEKCHWFPKKTASITSNEQR